MWRATLMALGLSMVVLGGEAMVVDRVVLADQSSDSTPTLPLDANSPYLSYGQLDTYSGAYSGSKRIFVPPDWSPWGLLSAGALTFLYSSSLPNDEGEGD